MLLRDRFDPRYYEPEVLFRYHAGWAGPTFSRASTATLIDRTGTLVEVGPDVPRIDWSHGRPALRLEGSRTNGIRNPRCEGAVIGVIGSGGAQPTSWLAPTSTATGLTYSVVATGVEDGIPYVDMRVQGTPSQAADVLIARPEDGQQGPASSNGEMWTGSAYVRMVGGTLNGVDGVWLSISERTSAGTFVKSHAGAPFSVSVGRLSSARRSLTVTLDGGATTERVGLRVVVRVQAAESIDLTLRIGGPQLEQSAVASSLILPPSGSPAASSRALDVPTAPWAHGLISFTGYVRFLETGGAQLMSATIALWFGAGDGEIWLRSSTSTPTYFITVRDSRGASAQVQASPGVTTQIGQLVELMPQVEVSSQGVRARLIQAVDGGVPVTSSWTGYVQTDWVPTTLRLVSRSGGSSQGQLDLRDLVALRGSDWTMDAVRRLLPW